MDKIILKHTCILITNYKLGSCMQLERNFQIWNPMTYSYHILGMKYDEDKQILYLPRGIDVWYLENLFDTRVVVDSSCYEYSKIENVKLKKRPRDDIQREALMFLTGEGKYFSNKSKSQLGLYLTTGKGKSYSSIAAISYFGVKSIIITYSVGWLKQWKDYFIEYTNFKEDEILMLNGSSVGKVIKFGTEKYKAFLVTHSYLKTYATTNGWDAVGELIKLLKVGIAVYDEAHLNFANILDINFHTDIWKTFYVTASPNRSNESESEVYGKCFKNVPAIELFDEDNDPHTDYVAIRYNSRPSPQEISECKNAYGLNRVEYTNYLVRKDNYYKLLRILLDLSYKANGKSLYYIGTNSAILETVNWIKVNLPYLYDDIGIYTSITPKEIKEKQLSKKYIFSTTKSCGAAVDIKGLKMTIVLNEPFKSPVLAQQTLGRTRADGTKYIDTVDMGFPQTRKYYKDKLNIFAKYAKSISEITLYESDMDARISKIVSEMYKESGALMYINNEAYVALYKRDCNADYEDGPTKDLLIL